jgi:hypothetical protein
MVEGSEVVGGELDLRRSEKLVERIKKVIDTALAYERATCSKRKLGITAEVGEVLVCHRFGLRLMLNPRTEGYDALDSDGKRVQIKTRRGESKGLPSDFGRIGQFSRHPFDYALLVILDQDYNLREVYRGGVQRPATDSRKGEEAQSTSTVI